MVWMSKRIAQMVCFQSNNTSHRTTKLLDAWSHIWVRLRLDIWSQGTQTRWRFWTMCFVGNESCSSRDKCDVHQLMFWSLQFHWACHSQSLVLSYVMIQLFDQWANSHVWHKALDYLHPSTLCQAEWPTNFPNMYTWSMSRTFWKCHHHYQWFP